MDFPLAPYFEYFATQMIRRLKGMSDLFWWYQIILCP